MGPEIALLIAVARILEPLHPALTPLIDAVDPPAAQDDKPVVETKPDPVDDPAPEKLPARSEPATPSNLGEEPAPQQA
jgi:hypothetical protein